MSIIDALLKSAGLRKPPPPSVRKEPRVVVRRGRAEGWEAAEDHDDLGGWQSNTGVTPNYWLATNIDKLRARARDAARNDSLVQGFLMRSVRQIVGSAGFRIKPSLENAGKKELDGLFAAHARLLKTQSHKSNFTDQRDMDRLTFEQYAVEALMRDGELIVQRLRDVDNETGYSLRVIDPDQLATTFSFSSNAQQYNAPAGERVIAGVGIDGRNRVKAIYLRKGTAYQSLWTYQAGEIERIPADDILLMFRHEWANQLRGVSPLGVVLRDLQTLKRYQRVLMRSARKNAAMSVAIKQEAGDPRQGGYNATENESSEYDAGTDADTRSAPLADLDGNLMPILNKGEDIAVLPNNFPGETAEPFMQAIKRQLAVGLGISPIGVTGDYGGINFSAGQLMHRDDEEQWKIKQQMLCELHRWWHIPWAQWCLERMLFRVPGGQSFGLNRRNLDALQTMVWYGQVFSPVDILKQANADDVLIKAGVLSRRAVIERMGLDADEIMEQWKEEQEAIAAQQVATAEAMANVAPKPAAGGGNDGGQSGGKNER